MKWFSSLSMFGRTLLLMIAALAVAEGIGSVLLITRPPIHNAPVSISELAWVLGEGPPRVDVWPRAEERPGREPQGPLGPGQLLPPDPRGPPGAGRPPGAGALPGTGGPRSALSVRQSDSPPQPTSKLAESQELEHSLAARMGVSADRVRLFIRSDRSSGLPLPGTWWDPVLGEGFVAAYKQDSSSWRVVESILPGFPDEFQRQAIWLFVLGLLFLLPLAWLFSRALVSPIQRFSLAAQRLGSDTRAEPLPSEGPPEMRAAIESFNAMQARLNRLLEERTHMIGAIAHDLRTPLTRLAFRLESLPPPLGDKVEADIQEMKAMICAALEFIRERSTGGRRERLDFRLLVESVVDDQTDVGHDVTLQEGDQIVMSGDPSALRRMVVNLVENALKYGERARLRLKKQTQECVLDIDDDGPGIPESMQERVFQPFYRIETSRNRNTGGIGLGLATVRTVALDHGGSVRLRNRAEGGLRVTVTIPVGM